MIGVVIALLVVAFALPLASLLALLPIAAERRHRQQIENHHTTLTTNQPNGDRDA